MKGRITLLSWLWTISSIFCDQWESVYEVVHESDSRRAYSGRQIFVMELGYTKNAQAEGVLSYRRHKCGFPPTWAGLLNTTSHMFCVAATWLDPKTKLRLVLIAVVSTNTSFFACQYQYRIHTMCLSFSDFSHQQRFGTWRHWASNCSNHKIIWTRDCNRGFFGENEHCITRGRNVPLICLRKVR